MTKNTIINADYLVDYLKEYKRKKKLTNRELAFLIGVHESSISRILRNEKGIGSKVIIGIMKNLEDLDLEKLLTISIKGDK